MILIAVAFTALALGVAVGRAWPARSAMIPWPWTERPPENVVPRDPQRSAVKVLARSTLYDWDNVGEVWVDDD